MSDSRRVRLVKRMKSRKYEPPIRVKAFDLDTWLNEMNQGIVWTESDNTKFTVYNTL